MHCALSHRQPIAAVITVYCLNRWDICRLPLYLMAPKPPFSCSLVPQCNRIIDTHQLYSKLVVLHLHQHAQEMLSRDSTAVLLAGGSAAEGAAVAPGGGRALPAPLAVFSSPPLAPIAQSPFLPPTETSPQPVVVTAPLNSNDVRAVLLICAYPIQNRRILGCMLGELGLEPMVLRTDHDTRWGSVCASSITTTPSFFVFFEPLLLLLFGRCSPFRKRIFS